MSSFIEQIKTAFEINNLTPEQIVESMGGELEVMAVKALLQQHSAKYRSICKHEPEDESIYNFDKDEMLISKEVIIDVMSNAQNPDGSIDYRTRFVAAKYVRDDKKGRLEPAKAMPSGNTNVLMMINQSIMQAREKASKVIDA